MFGYLTQLVTARRENIGIEEKWETTRPPTSRSKEPPAMLEMVFASRYVAILFYVNDNSQVPTCDARLLMQYR